TGLPAGLKISASGLITGTSARLQYATVTVRATDNTGASGTATFSWDDAVKGEITSGLSARRCVTARHGSAKSGTAIQIAACTGAGSQRWIVFAGPAGEDSIELASGGKAPASGCLAVRHGSVRAGAVAVTATCARTASLLWKPGSHGHLTG